MFVHTMKDVFLLIVNWSRSILQKKRFYEKLKFILKMFTFWELKIHFSWKIFLSHDLENVSKILLH